MRDGMLGVRTGDGPAVSIASIFGCRSPWWECAPHGLKVRKRKNFVERGCLKEERRMRQCLGDVRPDIAACAVEDGLRSVYWRRKCRKAAQP